MASRSYGSSFWMVPVAGARAIVARVGAHSSTRNVSAGSETTSGMVLTVIEALVFPAGIVSVPVTLV